MGFRFKIEGMLELKKSIKKLGKVPQKCVTPAARKGMNIALKDAKSNAPVDTGALKSGIKLVGEKSALKGKKVYRVVFDRAKNYVFQKPVKNPGEGNKKSKRTIAYYPASQEFGFFARDGKYIPGYHFVSKALPKNKGAIEKKIIEEAIKEIDKALEGK